MAARKPPVAAHKAHKGRESTKPAMPLGSRAIARLVALWAAR